MTSQISGFINLDKPPGISSFDCIRRLRRIIGQKKMGHIGTLDPPADGVLPVAAGSATRLIEYLEGGVKKYRSVFILGIITDTDDTAGNVIEQKPVEPFSEELIKEEIAKFQGKIMQTPPSVSAVHIEGQRAYQLARSGKKVEISPREIEIYNIELISYEHPYVTVEVTSSPGTYIRSIARDLGENLGCGGAVDKLRRLQSGPFKIEDSVKLELVEQLAQNDELYKIFMKPAKIFSGMPGLYLNDSGIDLIKNGRAIDENNILKHRPPGKELHFTQAWLKKIAGKFLAFDEAENIMAVLRKENDMYLPEKVFPILEMGPL